MNEDDFRLLVRSGGRVQSSGHGKMTWRFTSKKPRAFKKAVEALRKRGYECTVEGLNLHVVMKGLAAR